MEYFAQGHHVAETENLNAIKSRLRCHLANFSSQPFQVAQLWTSKYEFLAKHTNQNTPQTFNLDIAGLPSGGNALTFIRFPIKAV